MIELIAGIILSADRNSEEFARRKSISTASGARRLASSEDVGQRVVDRAIDLVDIVQLVCVAAPNIDSFRLPTFGRRSGVKSHADSQLGLRSSEIPTAAG